MFYAHCQFRAFIYKHSLLRRRSLEEQRRRVIAIATKSIAPRSECQKKKPPSGREVARSDGRREIHSHRNCEQSEQYHLPQGKYNCRRQYNLRLRKYNSTLWVKGLAPLRYHAGVANDGCPSFVADKQLRLP